MKKNFSKTFAWLLALLLLGISGVFSSFTVAAEPLKEQKAPEEFSKTNDSITLKAEPDTEYAIHIIAETDQKPETYKTSKDEKGKENPWIWAKEDQYNFEENTVTFRELKADTDYLFACRPNSSQEETKLPTVTIRTTASVASVPAIDPPVTEAPTSEPPITETPTSEPPVTELPKAATPSQPEIAFLTDTTIELNWIYGQEYTLVTEKEENYIWLEKPIFKNLKANTEYQFVTRIKASEEFLASDPSTPTIIKTKHSAANAPEIPVLAKRGEDFITLAENRDLEFAISTDTTYWKWQNSSTFTCLKPGNTYYFMARATYDPKTAMESRVSPVAVYKTYVAFNGSVSGIEAGKTYLKGTKLTASATDKSLTVSNISVGDSRWVPRSWNWDGKTNHIWDKEPYSIDFILDKAGTYKLTVDFTLQEYTYDGWKSADDTKSISVSFKAVNPIYTIETSAGKHGKISPDGKQKAEEGSSLSFTFTPEENYEVEKVLIDGVSVKFKNNKYTFTNITKSHKISVSFKLIDSKTAPKTGDSSPIGMILSLMTISVLLIILLFATRKKNIR